MVVVPSHVIRETIGGAGRPPGSADRGGLGIQGHREQDPPHHDGRA
ncbi:MAG: hypothetical protein MZV70_35375 [Desulfobacterales bacterium]|nr:hypothetical protein [Desulfobacterales bacterium]